MRTFKCITILVWLLCVNFCHAQSTNDWKIEAWEKVEQVLAPALITDDTLKYKLFDDSRLGSHNAASFYYRASLNWATLPKSHRVKLYDRREAWFDAPISELPLEEVEQWLEETSSVFKDLNKGLTGVCDWGLVNGELTFVEQAEMGFAAEQAVLSEFGDILRLRARLQVARSEFDEAIGSLADCIKLARDAGKLPAPFFGATMTTAIAFPAVQMVNEMSMKPGSPNLVSALQTLPRPISDYLSEIKLQHQIVGRSFLLLDNPEQSDRTDSQWRTVFLDEIEQLDQANGWNIEREYPNSEEELTNTRKRRLGILFAKLYPVAKRQLIEAGWNAKELNSMPVGKVIAIQTKRLWDAHVQLLNGLEDLPASKVHDRAMKLENSDLIYGEMHGCFPLNLIVFTQENLLRSRWQLIEISMNLQLLRDHLAKNGSFPTAEQFAKLGPLPDPDTGKPFQYRRLENGDAQLQSSPVFYEGASDRSGYVRVRYTIKKAGQK